jgi:hypothetical protein
MSSSSDAVLHFETYASNINGVPSGIVSINNNDGTALSYIADTVNNCITRLDINLSDVGVTSSTSVWASGGLISTPTALAINPSDYIYVVNKDGIGSNSNWITRVNISNGHPIPMDILHLIL